MAVPLVKNARQASQATIVMRVKVVNTVLQQTTKHLSVVYAQRDGVNQKMVVRPAFNVHRASRRIRRAKTNASHVLVVNICHQMHRTQETIAQTVAQGRNKRKKDQYRAPNVLLADIKINGHK